MANLFIALPSQAANGSGTAVDMSAFGAVKTIIVGGSWDLIPTINIEVNNDPSSSAGSWQSVRTFLGSGIVTVNVACQWMRVTVSNFRGGQAPVVNVGGTDDGTDFAALPAPAGTGVGSAVDVSALGVFKTVQVADDFRGSVVIEVSEDGGTTWGEQAGFQDPGLQSFNVAADFMRVRRTGVPGVEPGLPVVNVAACTIGAAPPTPSTAQVFSYEVTGLEPDPDNLVITLPAARANALYQVQVTQSTSTNFLGPQVAAASRTTTEFVLSLTSDATAGDIFWFTVEDPT